MSRTIAYQGEPGAYSDEAARQIFPGARTVGVPTFREAFGAVTTKYASAAVLPVENSLAGVVQEVSDLLWENRGLRITAEYVKPITHCLMTRSGEPAVRAISHPQALAQCAGWLRQRGIVPVPSHDTAGSARSLAQSGSHGDGAIASATAAERYHLTIVASDIADQSTNRTRFVVVEELAQVAEPDEGPARVSLGFRAEHRPGGLRTVLDAVARGGHNLTRLDSRPIPTQPFTYHFYADLDLEDASQLPRLMAELEDVAAELRLFGSYRRLPSD